ncbi:MAG TPA: hypothetical protein VE404_00465 [Verrucomicrobiae bacterium]|nr:hypothetical protein [Verrucomicrobiae bacterium]
MKRSSRSVWIAAAVFLAAAFGAMSLMSVEKVYAVCFAPDPCPSNVPVVCNPGRHFYANICKAMEACEDINNCHEIVAPGP